MANAHRAEKLGDFPSALRWVQGALDLQPNLIEGILLAATLEAKLGRLPEATQRLRGLVSEEPKNFQAVFLLSVVYRAQGDFELSVAAGEAAANLKPLEAHVYSNLGLSLLAAGKLQPAQRNFERAIQLAPSAPQNHFQLGKCVQLQGRDVEAQSNFERALRLSPNSFETLLALGELALSQNRLDDALDFGNQALKIKPDSPTAQLLIAGALIDQGFSVAAEYYVESVLESGSESANAYAMLGMRLQSLGRLEEATDAFQKSIQLLPEQGFSYCALLRNAKVDESRLEMLQTMERMCDQEKLPARGLAFLHYGAGKALEDLGRYQEALGHFDLANEISYRLKFGDRRFDRDAYARVVDWTIQTFDSKFISENTRGSNPSNVPIFIVGMMRSGTTLVEQILSSHPQVEGAGERQFWLRRASEPIAPGTRRFDPDRLAALSSEYLGELRALFPEAPHVTDKMPGNYRVLGLLALAFPNAKFVHVRRNPVDTCLSIYATPNRAAADFAHSRPHIVFAYQEYERLIAHWKATVDADRLLTVQYEELVPSSEAVIRKMVQFLGLEWDEACLRPQDNPRSVVTPSVWQVRQPVYTSSVERWRPYLPWLGPFAQLLPPDSPLEER